MKWLEALARRAVGARLSQLTQGQLTIREDGRSSSYGEPGSTPAVTVDVHDADFFTSLAFGGHVGAAEAYVRGAWNVDDLTDLIRIFLRNRDALDGLETGLARLVQPFRALIHSLNRNTRRGSRRNIPAHYDLGNEFFAAFLDETMTYSAGVFEPPDCSLHDASIEKYDRICRKLGIEEQDHVLEIGCGWGGFAIYAASEYGCRVTATTISPEQFRLATDRVREAQLDDRITLVQEDYRDLEGTFDKLVSIEMIEAVGHHYHDRYFERCDELLAPHGLAAIQSIVIQDRYYEAARREVDFIKRYIFPGSCIPSVSTLGAAARRTDLRLVDLEDITPHYAETLRLWRERFFANWEAIEALGYDMEFGRLWEFYFSYCEGGFQEAVIGDVQLIYAKPGAKGHAITRSPAHFEVHERPTRLVDAGGVR